MPAFGGGARTPSWIRDIDWGYGPWLSGVRSRGRWIGLSGAPFDGDAWINVDGGKDLRGEAWSIAGWVVELHDVRARTGDGPLTRLIVADSQLSPLTSRGDS